jgi:eukaryotic-like serine/threonine-protein kinase
MAEKLGPYTLERRIGSGGMADVFLARGPHGVCVIKRPHPHLLHSPDFIRMFLDEAALLAQLSHPGIARVFDLGHEGDIYYLAMEYVPGFDLMTISLEYERQAEWVAPELAARVVADAAAALHYAHEAQGARGQALNLVHRDVSPHNILVSTAGAVKVIDFGVAKQSSAMHRTGAGLVKGKYPYMAPEQVTGQKIDRRVDVYALGLVLYELLANSRAIEGDTEVEQIDNARASKIRPIEQVRGNVPEALRRVLAGCLHPDPAGRYPTAIDLSLDLETWLRMEGRIVGKADLLRLFRVVAADPSHQLPHAGLPGFAADGSDLERATTEEVAFPYGAPGGSSPARPVAVPRGDIPLPQPSPQPVPPSRPAALAAPIPLQDVVLRDTVPSQRKLDAVGLPQTDPDPSLRPTLTSSPTTEDQPPVVPPPAAPAPKPKSNAPLLGLATVVFIGGVLFTARMLSGGEAEVKPPEVVQAPPPEPPRPLPKVPSPGPEPAPPIPEPVVVRPPEPKPPPKPAPVPEKARVVVSPAIDAEIFLDGAPLLGGSAELKPGKHTVELKARDTGATWTTSKTVKAGEAWLVSPGVAKLEVNIVPYGTLRVGGVEVLKDRSYKPLSLWPGTYELEAESKDLKRAMRKAVTLKDGEALTLEFNLNQAP